MDIICLHPLHYGLECQLNFVLSFSVCLNQMKNAILEEGVPTKSVLLVYQKAFYNAGCLMANSLIQGGPSPAIFADWCYNYIASKEHFPPTDFSLPEQFKERRDIKKVNLFFFYSQTELCDIWLPKCSWPNVRIKPNKQVLMFRDNNGNRKYVWYMRFVQS